MNSLWYESSHGDYRIVPVAARVRVRVGLGLGLGLKEVFVFDSTSENRDRAVEAVEAVSEARAV